jgi:superfamily II DNA or RNA helicase
MTNEQQHAIICLTNVYTYVTGNLSEELKDAIRDKVAYTLPGAKYISEYQEKKRGLSPRVESDSDDSDGKKKFWDGTCSLARHWSVRNSDGTRCNGLVIPTGLYSMLREVFTQNDIPYTLEDQRQPAVTATGWSTEGFTLRDYQQGIEETMLNRQRGVMKMATGGGKTHQMLSGMINAACFPATFYVPSCDLLEQTYDVFSKHARYNGQPVEIGRIGNGHCDIRNITIATIQSCQMALEGKFDKFDEESPDDDTEFSESQKRDIAGLVRSTQFAYCDEAQHTSCKTIQAIFNNSGAARFRIGGSASPWRDDGLDKLIEACFGRKFCDITASFLIHNNYLVRPHIVFNHFDQFLGKAAKYQSAYSKYVVENDVRNRWVAERATYHVKEGRPTIILVKWSKHAEILQELLPDAEVLTSSGKLKKTPEKRKEVLDRMRERKLMLIIGTTLLDEGVDLPAANVGIFAGGGKSSTRALQRTGRIIRKDEKDPGKDIAYIEEFYDHTKWLDHHARARIKILSTEPEFQITNNRATMNL